MKKKSIAIFIIPITLCLILIYSYYRNKSQYIRTDLKNYITSLNMINQKKYDALKDYKDIVGINYKNDNVSFIVLDKLVIPKYSTFLYELKKIDPCTKVVKNLHESYLECCLNQFNSFNGFKDALEHKDIKKLKKNKALFKKSMNQYKKFNEKFKKLISKYNVNLTIN